MFAPSLMQALTPELAEEFITRRLQDDFVFSKEDWNQTTESRKTLGVPGLNRFLQIVATDPKLIIVPAVLKQIRKFREAGIADFDPDKNLEKIEARAAVTTDLVKRMMPAIADNDFSAQDWKDLKPVRDELISKLEQGGLAAFNMLFWALRAAGGKVDKKVHEQLQKSVAAGYMNASVVAGLTVYDSAPTAAPVPAPAGETEAERLARLLSGASTGPGPKITVPTVDLTAERVASTSSGTTPSIFLENTFALARQKGEYEVAKLFKILIRDRNNGEAIDESIIRETAFFVAPLVIRALPGSEGNERTAASSIIAPVITSRLEFLGIGSGSGITERERKATLYRALNLLQKIYSPYFTTEKK